MILLYHRVTRLETDPQLLAVSPAHFAEHLAVLSRTCRPMRLAELAAAAAEGTLPDRAVAVTFDDGYADNLHEAEPLLRRAGVPATVFATTGRTGTAEEYFWDELDRLLLQPGTLPAGLTLDVGRPLSFDLASSARYAAADWAVAKGWDVTQPAATGSRQSLYLELCAALHRATADQRSAALGELRRWAGAGADGRPSHRMMTADQLRDIVAGGVVEVGGHTVEHPLLSAETVDRQRAEVERSRETLTGILGRPVTAFSYPFGGRRDYTADTVAAVRAAGYGLACSNFQGKPGPGVDRCQLPRYIVRDWDGLQFARRLAGWRAAA